MVPDSASQSSDTRIGSRLFAVPQRVRRTRKTGPPDLIGTTQPGTQTSRCLPKPLTTQGSTPWLVGVPPHCHTRSRRAPTLSHKLLHTSAPLRKRGLQATRIHHFDDSGGHVETGYGRKNELLHPIVTEKLLATCPDKLEPGDSGERSEVVQQIHQSGRTMAPGQESRHNFGQGCSMFAEFGANLDNV